MLEFASFFIILLATLTFSALFDRLHLPWVLALIVGGIIIGPHGVDLLEVGPVLEFMGEIGLIFLMFTAGLEIPLSALRTKGSSISLLAFVNGFFPFLVGAAIAWWFGYGVTSILLMGIVFISSSVALIVPTLESSGLIKRPIGASILGTTLLQDITSLLLLSILLQSTRPQTDLPLPVFYLVLAIIFFFGRYVLRNINKWIRKISKTKVDSFEQELRSVFVVLLGTVIVFEMIGLHSLIAGFFAGLVLSESVKNDVIKQKLHAVSYGIFIPVFFFIVGAETDISVLSAGSGVLPLIIAVVIGSIVAKFVSGWVGARLVGYGSSQAFMFGASSIPQLSTTLAVAFTGQKLGLIDESFTTAIIILSVVTTFVSPLLMNWYVGKNKKALSMPFAKLG